MMTHVLTFLTVLNILGFGSLVYGFTCDSSPNGLLPSVTLKPLVKDVALPIHLAQPPNDTERLFIVSREGKVFIWQNGRVVRQPFIDVSDNLRTDNEQGLLSLAFHPNYQENGRAFVFYTRAEPFTSVISEFIADARTPNTTGPERVILAYPQESDSTMHRAGQLQFGPDGMLYASLGDAGYKRRSEEPETLNSKLIRLDVDTNEPYTIPQDNPFIGDPHVRDEVWAQGFRNPWRFSVDMCTGDAYVGDVGQDHFEEIARVRAGEHHGWPHLEAENCLSDTPERCNEASFTPPIHHYPHLAQDIQGGNAVIGGFVYRGEAMPRLRGAYIFTDSSTGRIYALKEKNGTWHATGIAQVWGGVVSFGQDSQGELYLASLTNNTVYKLIPEFYNASMADLLTKAKPVTIALEGWGELEGQPLARHRWAYGPHAMLRYVLDEDALITLKLTAQTPLEGQTITFWTDEGVLASVHDLSKDQPFSIQLTIKAHTGVNQLTASSSHWHRDGLAVSQSERRPLAFKLTSWQFSIQR